MIRLMLNIADNSYETTTAETPFSAIKLLANQKFDLYILDFQFPEMTGVELCRRIRQNDPKTPILFYTAMARPIDRTEAMNAGATEYLVKPNDLDRLAENVKRLLNKQERKAARSQTPYCSQTKYLGRGLW
jgi:DNA-binding response OmpR family regulator